MTWRQRNQDISNHGIHLIILEYSISLSEEFMPGAIISRICFYLQYPCRSEPARRPTFTMASRTASYAQGLSCGCQQRSRGKKRKRWLGMKLDRRTGLLASCLIWFEVQMSHYKFVQDLGACLNIKMPSYQYRDPHVKDKMTVLSLT